MWEGEERGETPAIDVTKLGVGQEQVPARHGIPMVPNLCAAAPAADTTGGGGGGMGGGDEEREEGGGGRAVGSCGDEVANTGVRLGHSCLRSGRKEDVGGAQYFSWPHPYFDGWCQS